jgi:hypothetical protein
MPVIGRLDEQVDAVLIAPLDGNGRRKTEARELAQEEQRASSQRGVKAKVETASAPGKRAERKELPVWLL